jgi:hypothetical protein
LVGVAEVVMVCREEYGGSKEGKRELLEKTRGKRVKVVACF